MALTFPLSLADFSDKLGIATLTPRQGLQQELSSQGSGDEIAADLSPAKREYDVVCAPQYHGDAGQLMALIESLRGPMNPFYITDPRYPYPAADPGGALLLNGSSIPVGGVAALGDFTTGVYALDGVAAAQSDAISNTRASAGTYFDASSFMRTAAVDTLRLDHGPSGVPLGALIETTATNLLPYSNDYTQSAWVKTRCTLTAGALLGPDGAMSGTFVNETTDTGAHGCNWTSTSLAAGTKISFTTWLNPAYGRNFAYLTMDGAAFTGAPGANPNVHFQLTGSGSVVGSGGVASSRIDAYPGGWYRLEIDAVTYAAGTLRVYATPATSAGASSNSYAGTVGNGIGIGPALLVLAPSAGSDIATAGAAATRAADALTIKALGVNDWTLTFDDGSTQLFPSVSGDFTIDPTAINRPHIKSYQATRLAQPAPSTVTINSLNVNNKAMSLAGLPPGYVITRGDFLAWDYGSSPTRRAYLRAAETMAANPSGVTPEFQLSDFIKTGSTTGLVVTLIKPAMKAKLISGSVQEQAGNTDPMFTNVQFSVRQVL